VSPNRYSPFEIAGAVVFVIAGLIALGALWAGRPCLDCPILRTSASTATLHGQVGP
jgi:hypothetical protein